MTTTIPRGNHHSFAFLHEALAAAQAVKVAEQLGVLARLAEAPADATMLARDCGVSARGVAALLEALASVRVIEAVEHGLYRVSDQPFPLAELSELWSGLEAAIRTGEPTFNGGTPREAAANYPRIVPKLRLMFASLAERFADRVTRPGMRVVDLGAGGAPWSIALAKRDPSCHVTAVDVPGVITETRQSVVEAGCSAQFAFVEGDLFEVDWAAGGHDLAIVGNLCHLFDGRTNAAMLARIFGALRPEGRVAILDVLPDEGGRAKRGVALYALGLMLRTSAGRVYPFSTYATWLRSAGYEAIERVDLSGAPPIALVTARRITP